jgi:hypothetical protein
MEVLQTGYRCRERSEHIGADMSQGDVSRGRAKCRVGARPSRQPIERSSRFRVRFRVLACLKWTPLFAASKCSFGGSILFKMNPAGKACNMLGRAALVYRSTTLWLSFGCLFHFVGFNSGHLKEEETSCRELSAWYRYAS